MRKYQGYTEIPSLFIKTTNRDCQLLIQLNTFAPQRPAYQTKLKLQ